MLVPTPSRVDSDRRFRGQKRVHPHCCTYSFRVSLPRVDGDKVRRRRIGRRSGGGGNPANAQVPRAPGYREDPSQTIELGPEQPAATPASAPSQDPGSDPNTTAGPAVSAESESDATRSPSGSPSGSSPRSAASEAWAPP